MVLLPQLHRYPASEAPGPVRASSVDQVLIADWGFR